ncbi:monovalent cation/H+ antiporter subunit A [Marinimicrobium sp. C6131]|uniref:monovalent cation/H+ antiporter subunit A n=1 Tax=Marinimicrobium sp. C6131 TaxID=3022676 RepID=UPI00223D0E6A|nr:monovalent cation/H+ antiporter subunit A [Marinimicrobium sp. C6131]UZJ46121.1 monovalent cation/H+ antiporter subunit A [Marinimicrobium sp. C6131]
MTLFLIVFLPLLGALVPLATERFGRNLCAWSAALAPLISLGLLLYLTPAVLAGETFRFHQAWLPGLGLDLSLRLDGLGLMFALLITGIGLLVMLYARYYLSSRDSLGKLYALLQIFMLAMLGIVLSDNILLMLVFWELTSLSSFLLIGYWSHQSEARKGARMALAITGAGGLCLLAGALLLGHIVGSFNLTEILAAGDQIRAHALYPITLILVLLGAFTKSAQFPFHFWLPHAMSAPTPVSAYLHSATMVKAGVFLLARLYPALAGTELWFFIVSFVGLATLVYAAYTALFKHDLKGLLAYSTISHLGLITLLFGFSTELAAAAAVFHIINHATFKASLFMAAGIIDHETGTRDMRKINGLWKYMPHTALLAMVASAAMAGVPLLNGFLSKEMFFAESLHLEYLGQFWWIMPMLATLGALFSVAYSWRFIHDVFFNGEPQDLPKYPPHEPPRYMKVPVEILVVLCLIVGVFPHYTIEPFIHAAATAVLGHEMPEYHIALWHGFNLPLLMSAIALAGGILLYSQRKGLFAFYERKFRKDEKLVFEYRVQRGVLAAQWVTDRLENGSLQRYLALFFGAALVVGAAGLWPLTEWTGSATLTPMDPVSAVATALLVIAAFGTVLTHHNRFAALLMLSVVGLIVSLTFIRFSAPDLALTQLSVEVVTIVLLMLALYFLPQMTPNESPPRRVVRDIAIAGSAGVGVGALCWAVLTRPFTPISDYFLENSVSGGGGTNVVNVILVDFRGFDTLGEITVLALAAVGIYAMLHGLKLPLPQADGDGRRWAREPHPPILSVMTRILLPLAIMVSFYIFLRGHNMPGGGFIAGLVTSVALILQYISTGTEWMQQRLRWNYRKVAATGVMIATLTGLASWLFGYPFLTSTFTHVHWPFVGDFELASAMAFDVGVYVTVVGATMLILAHLGKLAQTTHEAPATNEQGEKI